MRRYICIHCFHEWHSNNVGRVLRCSNCHRRQGVSYEKFRKAVDATKTSLRKVTESPPPHPPPLKVISHVSDALDPVLEVAKSEFPNPLVPITLFKEVLARAIEELKETSPEDNLSFRPKA